jgi:hypothetical protein
LLIAASVIWIAVIVLTLVFLRADQQQNSPVPT